MMSLRCTDCYREQFARTQAEAKECQFCGEPLELLHISTDNAEQTRMNRLLIAREIMQQEEFRAWEAYNACDLDMSITKEQRKELLRIAQNRTDVLGEIVEAIDDEVYLQGLLEDVMRFAPKQEAAA